MADSGWSKVEAFSEKEAAQKVCGIALTDSGKLAQLRARVLTLVRRRYAERDNATELECGRAAR